VDEYRKIKYLLNFLFNRNRDDTVSSSAQYITNRVRSIQSIGIILACIGVFGSTVTVSYNHLNRLLEKKFDILLTSLNSDIAVFEYTLNLIDRDLENTLSNVLPLIAESLAHLPNTQDTSSTQLSNLARTHDVSDVYLINDDLVVTNASMQSEIGLDMSSFSDEYTDYLEGMLGQGHIKVDPISLEHQTGQLRKYAYYSPVGSNLIINVDINVSEKLKSSDQTYSILNSIIKKLANRHISENEDILDFDVFLITKVNQWSLFNPGKELPRTIAGDLLADNSPVIKDDGVVTLFQKVSFPRYEKLGYKLYAMVKFDESYRTQFLLSALGYSLLGMLLVLLLIWWITGFALHMFVLNRVNKLMTQIDTVRPDQFERISITGDDEISKIGMKINKMLDRFEAEKHDRVRFEHLSSVDQLTGIGNRRALDEMLTAEVSRVIRSMGNLTVIMIDIDFFKGFNDCYGHTKGDDALKQVASILTDCVRRPSDTVCRYGGEEFVCLIPGIDYESSHELSNKIIDKVSQANIIHRASPLNHLTVSLGCVFVTTGQNGSPEQLIIQADKHLYSSKLSGKSRATIAKFVED
jgi:diguanylate cyclase (GGDEF)-like protein